MLKTFGFIMCMLVFGGITLTHIGANSRSDAATPKNQPQNAQAQHPSGTLNQMMFLVASAAYSGIGFFMSWSGAFLAFTLMCAFVYFMFRPARQQEPLFQPMPEHIKQL